MNVEVESQPNSYCRLIVNLTAEEVETGYAQATRKVAKQARVPGFRPGKVPAALLARQFGPNIEQEAFDQIVRSTLFAAISEKGLRAVDRPVLESVDLKRGASGRYVATVELYPTIAEVTYEGLSPVRHEPSVAAEAIDERLEKEREKGANTVPVEGRTEVQMNDYVLVDFAGTVAGQPLERGSQQNELVHVQAGQYIPGFVEGLVGHAVPGEATVQVQFPSDYGNAQLAGKPAQFHFTLRELKEQKKPALDDEFARDAGHDSLSAMRAAIEQELLTAAQADTERKNEQALLDALVAANPFELSSGIVDRQIESMIAERESRLKQLLGGRYHLGDDERIDLRTSLRANAEASVRAGLLVDEVAKAAQGSATDEAMQAFVERWRERRAASGEARPDDGFDAFVDSSEGRDQVRFNVVREQVMALMRAAAKA
jgi:trigger factor